MGECRRRGPLPHTLPHPALLPALLCPALLCCLAALCPPILQAVVVVTAVAEPHIVPYRLWDARISYPVSPNCECSVAGFSSRAGAAGREQRG